MSKVSKILIIEDEKSIMKVLVSIISEENENFEVHQAFDGEEGLNKIKSEEFHLVISDIKMPKYDGLMVLEKALKIRPDLPFIMISGHGDIDDAVSAIKLGAYDYISKPPDLNQLLTSINNALARKELIQENQTLKTENKTLKKKIKRNFRMIGESVPIIAIKEMIEKVAKTDARVLITGANGTGKELVAHALHDNSSRAKRPMIEVNCAAIPSELIESELFGHMKGAFTGAIKDKKGKLELASSGTIFLDEIGDMSLSAQAKVLRALQEGKITRVGGDKEIKIDVRILSATNKDLQKEIAEGNFREDLYHRLAVILMKVPSLDERKEDIPLLIEHFSQLIAEEQGNSPKIFKPEAIKALQKLTWSGNIRELRNVVERLIILGGEEISPKDVADFVKI